MARLPRLVIPGQPHHVMQHGNDSQLVFRDTDDYRMFLDWLREAARQFKVAIHAYALLPNRLHLLLTPSDRDGLARMMQWIGRQYVPYFNRKYGRTGTLWQGRFKTVLMQADHYFIMCSRYIELSPVAAGLASAPVEYPWSSYAHHVGLKPDPLVSDHALYWALGNTPFEREAIYKAATEQALSHQETMLLDTIVTKGGVLGSEEFKAGLERVANRRVRAAKRGRPFKVLAGQVTE